MIGQDARFVEPKRTGQPRENCPWRDNCYPRMGVLKLLRRVVKHRTAPGSFTDEEGAVRRRRAPTVMDDLPESLQDDVRVALSVLEQKEKEPRYRYDCQHCKFSWNCGPLCSCVLRRDDVGPTPLKRMREVQRLVAAWRKQRGL